MKYFILSVLGDDGEKYAKLLSTLVFNIIRPISVKDPDDMTTELYPWIRHWETGEVAITIPDSAEGRKIYTHPKSDISPVIESLQVELPQSEINKLINDIDKFRGQTIDIASVLPISLLKSIKSEDEMKEEGWFYDKNTNSG